MFVLRRFFASYLKSLLVKYQYHVLHKCTSALDCVKSNMEITYQFVYLGGSGRLHLSVQDLQLDGLGRLELRVGTALHVFLARIATQV